MPGGREGKSWWAINGGENLVRGIFDEEKRGGEQTEWGKKVEDIFGTKKRKGKAGGKKREKEDRSSRAIEERMCGERKFGNQLFLWRKGFFHEREDALSAGDRKGTNSET